MKFALIQNFKIERIVDIDPADLMKYSTRYQAVYDLSDYFPLPEVGTEFDGVKLVAPKQRRISKLGLRNRFTFNELMAITTAAKTNVAVQVLVENMQVATWIDLNRPDTLGALNLLVSVGLLTPERAEEIRIAPISEFDKYTE